MKVGHTYGKKWPEKVAQMSFIKGHLFPNSLYVQTALRPLVYCSDIYTVYTDYLYDRQGHQKGLGDFLFCLKKPILYSFGNGVMILKVNKMRC